MTVHGRFGFHIVSAVILFAVGPGCGEDDGPTSSGGTPQQLTAVLRVTIPGFPTLALPDRDVTGGVVATYNPHSGSPDVHGNELAIAAFLDAFGLPTAYAGTVSVNGNQLDTVVVPPQGFIPALLFYYAPEVPGTLDSVEFNGSSHSWSVSGGSTVTGFTEAVPSPAGDVFISSPAVLAEVPRSQQLMVQWTGVGESDSVLVMVTDSSGTGTTVAVMVAGSSATFAAATMGTLAAGEAVIDVQRINYRLFTVSGRRYMIAASSTDRRTVLLR